REEADGGARLRRRPHGHAPRGERHRRVRRLRVRPARDRRGQPRGDAGDPGGHPVRRVRPALDPRGGVRRPGVPAHARARALAPHRNRGRGAPRSHGVAPGGTMNGIPRTEWIWRDGTFIPWEAATVHVMSHVVHYGSSFFEGIRCYSTPNGPAIFRLRDHLRRLHDSCRIYRTELPFSVETLAQACCELVARNGLEDCYIRPVVFRGVGAPGLNPAASPVETYLVCWPWGAYLGADALERGVDVRVSSWSRMAPNTFPAMAKAGGNYIAAQLMKMEALADGYAEAIALDPNGLVSEGSGENVFLVRDEVLITPALNGSF